MGFVCLSVFILPEDVYLSGERGRERGSEKASPMRRGQTQFFFLCFSLLLGFWTHTCTPDKVPGLGLGLHTVRRVGSSGRTARPQAVSKLCKSLQKIVGITVFSLNIYVRIIPLNLGFS